MNLCYPTAYKPNTTITRSVQKDQVQTKPVKTQQTKQLHVIQPLKLVTPQGQLSLESDKLEGKRPKPLAVKSPPPSKGLSQIKQSMQGVTFHSSIKLPASRVEEVYNNNTGYIMKSQPPLNRQISREAEEELSLNASGESIKGDTLFNDESLDNGRILLETICESDSKKTYSRSPSSHTPKIPRILSSLAMLRHQQSSCSPKTNRIGWVCNTEYDEPHGFGYASKSDRRRLQMKHGEGHSNISSSHSLVNEPARRLANDFILSRKGTKAKPKKKNSFTEMDLSNSKVKGSGMLSKHQPSKLKMVERPFQQQVEFNVIGKSIPRPHLETPAPFWSSATGSQVVETQTMPVPVFTTVRELTHQVLSNKYKTAEQLLLRSPSAQEPRSPPRSYTLSSIHEPAPSGHGQYQQQLKNKHFISEVQAIEITPDKRLEQSSKQSKIETGPVQQNRKTTKVIPALVHNPTSRHSTHDLVNMLLKSSSIQNHQGISPYQFKPHLTASQPYIQEQATPTCEEPKASQKQSPIQQKISSLVSQNDRPDKGFDFYDFGLRQEIKRVNQDIDTMIRRASRPKEGVPIQTTNTDKGSHKLKREDCLTTSKVITQDAKVSEKSQREHLTGSAVLSSKTPQQKLAPPRVVGSGSEYFDPKKYLASKTTQQSASAAKLTKPVAAPIASALQINTSKVSGISAATSVKSLAAKPADQKGSRGNKILADKFLTKLIKKYEKKPEEPVPEGTTQQPQPNEEGAVSLQSLLKKLIYTGVSVPKNYPSKTSTQGVKKDYESSHIRLTNFTRDNSTSSNVSSSKSLSTPIRAGSFRRNDQLKISSNTSKK